jgi:hypothetical protein
MTLSSVLLELFPLFAVPGAAAVIGLTIGRLVRGPKKADATQIGDTRYFEVQQAAGVVRGRKATIAAERDASAGRSLL